jgi:RimJ/RimL family protein N-acetyltransferase
MPRRARTNRAAASPRRPASASAWGAAAAGELPAVPIASARLGLEPLTVEHADEMVAVLADPGLYRHTGGAPDDLQALRRRYERQTRGESADGDERWLNWVIRLPDGGVAVGYIQATVLRSTATADVAWVVGTKHQGRGYATEAAAAAIEWLVASGVHALTAHIADANLASQAVARRLGFRPTSVVEDGEVVWQKE